MEKNKEYEITSNLFGGYNKKETRAYIKELENLLKDTQDELNTVKSEKTLMEEKLKEAESCYRVLWEKSKFQEEELERQREVLAEFAKNIKKDQEIQKDQKIHKETVTASENPWDVLVNKWNKIYKPKYAKYIKPKNIKK